MTSPHDPFGTPDRQSSGASSYGDRFSGTYGAPPAGGGWARAPQETRTETKAVLAIVLAVLAWTPIVPFVGAIVALVLARMARRDIEASGGRLTGLGLCTWAVVLSWVHLAVVALLAVVVVAVFLLPVAFTL